MYRTLISKGKVCQRLTTLGTLNFPLAPARSRTPRYLGVLPCSQAFSTEASVQTQLPKETKVVICGGGVIGCSVAYHLALQGWKDIVLLEQGRWAVCQCCTICSLNVIDQSVGGGG